MKRRHDLRVDALGKQLAMRLSRWLAARAEIEAGKAIARVKSGRVKIAKAAGDEYELMELLLSFGIRQTNDAGKRSAKRYGGKWTLEPRLMDSIITDKEIKVQRILETIDDAVKRQLRDIMRAAQSETPQPSTAEISRRISMTFVGPSGGRPKGKPIEVAEPGILPTEIQPTTGGPLYVFSPERASLIARTEAAQNENTGIFEGMKISGIDKIKWQASLNPNHGDRRHDLMHNKTINVGDKFKTPLGHFLRYPGDPAAPIKETANCGCTIVPVL